MQKPTRLKSKNLSLIKKPVANKREVATDEKHQLIATAAYFRAERRNFIPGFELQDWLEAEAEIEMRLAGTDVDSQPKNA